MEPVRIQRKRTKGWRMQEASPNGLPVVYVGRPTKFGNPYTGTSAVACYRMELEWFLSGKGCFQGRTEKIKAGLRELRGKNLCCWCGPAECHADVLLELANKEEPE